MKVNINSKFKSVKSSTLDINNLNHYKLLRKLVVHDTNKLSPQKREYLMNLSKEKLLNPDLIMNYAFEVASIAKETFEYLIANYTLEDCNYDIIAEMFTEEICRPFH